MRTLDVNLQLAAQQRSELSPRRGFASLGSKPPKESSPEGATAITGNKRDPVYELSVAAARLRLQRTITQGFAKPHLGLNSDRCYAANSAVTGCCLAGLQVAKPCSCLVGNPDPR